MGIQHNVLVETPAIYEVHINLSKQIDKQMRLRLEAASDATEADTTMDREYMLGSLRLQAGPQQLRLRISAAAASTEAIIGK